MTQAQGSSVGTILTQIREAMGPMGRLLSQSKSGYRDHHPRHITVFNANLFVVVEQQPYKAWFGDIDITVQELDLMRLSTSTVATLYVLREHMGRFGAEDAPKLNLATYWTNGIDSRLGDDYAGLWERQGGKLLLKEES